MFFYMPQIYQDEILYSVLARYNSISGNLNLKDTLIEVFGYDTIVPTIAFPSLLENLSSKVSVELGYDSGFFINRCTLLPTYIPFLSKNRRNMVTNDMKFTKGNRISNLLGIQAGHIFHIKQLKYCPKCAINDYKKYNDVFFHRVHQPDGVNVCSEHGCFLKEYHAQSDLVSRLKFIRMEYSKLELSTGYEHDKTLSKWYKEIAKAYEYLLNNELSEFDSGKVHKRYIELLDKRELVTANKRVRQIELALEFKNFYGENLLNVLESNIDEENEDNWLKKITRKQKHIIHPLRHILFIYFLCDNINEFFSITNKYHPFGQGPWPCLNKAADHYRENIIQDCVVTDDYKTREPVGTFKCSCGFIYSRKGPDKTDDDRYRLGRIKCFGDAWERKLNELISRGGFTLRGLANEMNCDPKTVVKYSTRIGSIGNLNVTMKEQVSSDCIGKSMRYSTNFRDRYRQELIECIRQHPEHSRTNIRKCLQKQYTWLYRYDKEWLMDNLPTKTLKEKIDYKSTQRVDWNKRDLELYGIIKEEYKKILLSDKLRRITKSLIGSIIRKSSILDKHSHRLPKTNELLSEICESVEEFQIRRLRSVARHIYDEKGYLKKWEVIRAAGIRKSYEIKMGTVIDNILNEFGQADLLNVD
ncbi:TnsD family transposase [Clostridium saccharoperbutylacetonicum]|uniref:TnsD family transposase n=1 Tax=Clostridium saccharoperbutylacetonicum TaxID=36745 RepID=UPI0039E939E2